MNVRVIRCHRRGRVIRAQAGQAPFGHDRIVYTSIFYSQAQKWARLLEAGSRGSVLDHWGLCFVPGHRIRITAAACLNSLAGRLGMDDDFEQLIGRVRAGDPDAAVILVKDYESAVRVAVRARLFDPELRRQFDSTDICQSVLGSFFVRVAAGQFDLQRPSQLVALLTKMARNKIAGQARYHRQKRRDIRRKESQDGTITQLTSGPDPAQQAQAKELLERMWQSMDLELREIASRRLDGQSWEQVAMEIGGTAGARRKQFERGLDEIAERLGIDEENEHAR